MVDERGDQKKAGSEFSLRTKPERWEGGDIIMTEPTLAEGLELADSYFDMVVDTTPGRGNKMQVSIRESAYIQAVCQRYFSPAIDTALLPMRMYRDVRRLVDVWEDFSGMRAVRETMASQVSDSK